MASVQIPNLPAVVGLDGTELFEGVQAGTSVKISLAQMIAATRGGLPTTLPIPVSLGGTGVTTLTGYVKGSGTSPFTASPTIPNTDITGLGTMSTQNANAVAITGGTAALTGASSVTVNSASAALTVTQTGAGNAFVVEDSASDTTPFIVDTAGNVGVGTSSVTPIFGRTVQVGDGSSVSSISLIGTGAGTTGDVYLASTGSEASLTARASTPLIFGAGDVERMRIDASGNVGIGASPPSSKLELRGASPQAITISHTNGTGYDTSLTATYSATQSLSLVSAGVSVLAFRPTDGAAVIGTKLRVDRGASAPEIWLNGASGTDQVGFKAGTAGLGAMEFYTSALERFRFGASGQFGIGGANYGTSGQTIVSAGSGAAPAWGALGAAGGGTGITSYTIGDIVYASGTTTLSKLADVATGNALISGGVGVAPSYGKIGLTTHVSGTLPVANGGTGQASNLTQYGIVYGSTTTAMAATAAGTTTTVLHGNAAGAPTFGAVSLTADVSGTLPVANGGTGVTTAPAEAARIMGYTSTPTTAATTTLTNASTQYQLFTGATTQTIALPVTSTLTTGWTFHIVNNSTGTLTVNSSGGNLVCTVISGMTAMVTCIATATTTAADWEFGFTDFGTITGTGAVVLASSPAITGGSIDNMTVGATTQASVRGTSLVSNSVITDGFNLHAAGTLALAFATDGVAQVTPNATGTFTTTVPAAGTRCTLIVLTSGTTSYTMTFGTGFKTTGTLATGTVSARYFVFQFISDGTSVIEASRTVAIA